MNYTVDWTYSAINSYYEETNFIYLKWNQKEVLKFENLVDENLERLSKNPEIGTFDKKFNVYTLVISKQTTLYYGFDTERKIIDLYVFWNNLKNPEDLEKLL